MGAGRGGGKPRYRCRLRSRARGQAPPSRRLPTSCREAKRQGSPFLVRTPFVRFWDMRSDLVSSDSTRSQPCGACGTRASACMRVTTSMRPCRSAELASATRPAPCARASTSMGPCSRSAYNSRTSAKACHDHTTRRLTCCTRGTPGGTSAHTCWHVTHKQVDLMAGTCNHRHLRSFIFVICTKLRALSVVAHRVARLRGVRRTSAGPGSLLSPSPIHSIRSGYKRATLRTRRCLFRWWHPWWRRQYRRQQCR